MTRADHLTLVMSDAQVLHKRLLRLAAALAYTQEYAAELLEQDGDAPREPGAQARNIAEECRRFLLRMRTLSPQADEQNPVPSVDVRRLGALAFENAPVAMTIARLSGTDDDNDEQRPRAVAINRAFADMLGFRLDELLTAEDQARFTYSGDRATDLEHTRRLQAHPGDTAHWFKRYVHADGTLVWARVSAAMMRDPHEVDANYLVAQIREVNEDTAEQVQTA